MIRKTLAAAALALAASPALAGWESRTSDDGVGETMDRLVSAVEGAGATVFARVNHAEGAAGVGMELPDAEVLIFGNPELGTQAMQDDIRAGLVLPLRVLVYDDAGQTVILWQEPEEMFGDLTIDDDAAYIESIEDALDTLTGAAAG
ncbi:DUF302 domain-containing protein [Tropicimonas sp. IMCC34011]|uniref:DUF302 domain-containing protein n=1 Tax=Tropicimonas sp. IMCC34011 TaxID=2248759 RepID=UPI000E2455FB|nr:DUF302 domain-containing protein [Tropicimonas sp. IMCC34011]